MYTRVSETIFCLLHFIWFKHIEPCDVTSLVLRSVKKIQKISKPALFWKVQVDQEKQKKPHVKIDISIKSYKMMTKKDVKSVLFQNFVNKFVPVVFLRCTRISHYHVVLCNGSTSILLGPLPYRRMISIYYASMQ